MRRASIKLFLLFCFFAHVGCDNLRYWGKESSEATQVPGGPFDQPVIHMFGDTTSTFAYPADSVRFGSPIEILEFATPPHARSAKVPGDVFVQVRIAKDGTVRQVAVHAGSQTENINEAVQAAFKHRFTPFILRGDTVEVWIKIPFAFKDL